jgi:light-regulated signal transduction histidine kinase (bacteriophytochrome)
LRFPASDIPIQARQLFLTNAVRAIADVASTPVPIVPQIGPLTGRALDLSHTFLRSASLLHVEYLRNMGVRSSLTVSIVVEERLWGMIACHHHAPRPIDCLTRSVCEMVARNLALQVGLWDANATRRSRLRSHDLLDDYADRREGSASPADAESLAAAQFVDLLDADGVIARIDGVVSVHGVAPSEKALHPIIRKLRTLALRGVASSDTLRALDDSAESYAREASGALYIALNERTADYLLFVRRELIETVTWAGNPDKSVSADTAGRLHPRKSFAAWQQTVHGQARPWSDVDIENARALRGQLRHLQDARRLRE